MIAMHMLVLHSVSNCFHHITCFLQVFNDTDVIFSGAALQFTAAAIQRRRDYAIGYAFIACYGIPIVAIA